MGVLCNKASLPQFNEHKDKPTGDPMEVALLVAGAKAELRRQELLETYSEVRDVPFDSDTKMMATIHEDEQGYRFAVKGAPESILDVCTQQLTLEGVEDLSEDDKNGWRERCDQLAKEGLRILAFASKNTDNLEAEPCLTRLGMKEDKVVTISFLTLAFGRLWHVFNMRNSKSGLLRNEVTTNRYVWLALLVCTGLLLTAVYFSPLANVLKIVNPGLQGWGLILGGSLIPLVLGQILKAIIPSKWFAL